MLLEALQWANVLVGGIYTTLAFVPQLKFLLVPARIWTASTGAFFLQCGLCNNCWTTSEFRRIWFILVNLSITVVPAFVFKHHGFHYQKLNLVFGIPCLLIIPNILRALPARKSDTLCRAGAKEALSFNASADVTEASEKLLHRSADLLTTGAPSNGGGSHGPYGSRDLQTDGSGVPITIFSTPPPGW